jgi:lysine 2,3-aminomutase
MNDQKFNLVPEDLQRLNRREKYQEDPTLSLKDKSEKGDEMKEKKFKVEQKKYTERPTLNE